MFQKAMDDPFLQSGGVGDKSILASHSGLRNVGSQVVVPTLVHQAQNGRAASQIPLGGWTPNPGRKGSCWHAADKVDFLHVQKVAGAQRKLFPGGKTGVSPVS